MKKKSVVLLSGGLDSVTNLYLAKEQTDVVATVTFNYGQRAATQELKSAQYFSNSWNIPNHVFDVSSIFKKFGQSSLVDHDKHLPVATEISIDDMKVSQKSAQSVWVPNRNGIFLNLAAGLAESLRADIVIPGFNIEEAATFPDNTDGFLNALTTSFSYSTANQVKAICLTTELNKTQIVSLGKQRNLPFKHLWPCYQANESWCLQCESCLRFARALKANGIDIRSLTC